MLKAVSRSKFARRHNVNSLPIKKMEVARSKAVAFAELCTSLPIKTWRFRGVFDGFREPLSLLYDGRIIVRVMEFSL
jgi:hypothetical protein